MANTNVKVDLKRCGSDPCKRTSQVKNTGNSSTSLNQAQSKHIGISELNNELHNTKELCNSTNNLQDEAQLKHTGMSSLSTNKAQSKHIGIVDTNSKHEEQAVFKNRLRLNDNALMDAYSSRCIRPVVSTHNLNKAMKTVPPARGLRRTYDCRNPVWSISPKTNMNELEWNRVFMLYETLVNIGIPIHPLMQDKFFRRVYYAKLMNGEVHHLFKNLVYHYSEPVKKILKRNLKTIGNGLYDWLCEDRTKKTGNKKISLIKAYSMVEGKYNFSCKSVEAHGNIFIDKYRAMPQNMKIATNMLGGAVLSGIASSVSQGIPTMYTAALIAGVTYLGKTYMDYKSETIVYKILMRKLGMLKEYVISSFKTVRDLLAGALEAIAGTESSTAECLINYVGIALTGYALWKILYNSPEGQEQIKMLIPMESRNDVQGHGGGFGPILTTFLVSLCVLPTPAVNMLRSYRSISQIYGDVIGPQGISTFLKTGVNFVCELVGAEKLFDIIDFFQDISNMIEEMHSVIVDDKLVEKQAKDKNFYVQVFDLQRRAWSMYSSLIRAKDVPMNMMITFKDNLRKIDEIVDQTRCNNITFTKREPLTVIYFPGPPGRGKSTLCEGITQAVFQMLFKKKMSAADTWRKNYSSEYDDGYKAQWHIDIPEIFSSKMPTTNEPQANMFKLWCDSAAYPMNMSRANEKGKYFFCSKILTMSSNDSSFENIGIKKLGSIYRRINFPMHVERKDNIDPNKKVNRKDLDSAWELSITAHAKANRHLYTGVSKCLGNDWDRVYTVSEFISIVYDHYVYTQTTPTVSDLFEGIDWRKELMGKGKGKASSSSSESSEQSDLVGDYLSDDSYSSDYIKDFSEVIDGHGLFSAASKLIYGDEYYKLCQWLKGKTTVDVITLTSTTNSIQRLGASSNHAGLYLYNGTSAKTLHFVETVTLDNYYKSDEWDTDGIKYVIKTENLLPVVKNWMPKKWSISDNCHSFVQEIMRSDYPEFTMKIWTDSQYSSAEMGDNRKPIKKGLRYFDKIRGGVYSGREMRRHYPSVDTGNNDKQVSEVYMPSPTVEYLTYPLVDQWSSVATNPLEYYSVEQKFIGGHERYYIYRSGHVIEEFYDKRNVDLWKAEKPSARHIVVIGGGSWIIDFSKYDQTTFSKYKNKAMNFITTETPSCVKEYVDSNGKLVFLDIAILLGAAYALHTCVAPIMTKCISYMWTWMFPMQAENTQGHSVQKTVQFKPKGDNIVVKGHTSGNVSVIANVASNTVDAEVIYDVGTMSCKMFFINNKNALIVKHAIMRPGQIRAIRIKADGSAGQVVDIKDIIVQGFEGSEMKQLTFKTSQGSFKDMRKKYMTKNELSQEFDSGQIIRKNYVSSNKKMINVTQNLITKLHKGTSVEFNLSYHDIDGTTKTYALKEKYTAFSTILGPGDCVTPLIVEVNGNLKILGHYFGQVEGVSYFAPMFQERLKLDKHFQIPPVRDEDITVKANAKVIEGLTCIGKLPSEYRGPIVNKILDGPILKTELGTEGMFDIKKYRASLSGPVVDYAFKFANGQRSTVDSHIIRQLKIKYPLIYYKGFAEVPQRDMHFLSVEDAIFSNDFGIKSLDQTTSTGPYLSLGLGVHKGLPKSSKRRDFFDHQTRWILPEFKTHLEEIRENHEAGNQHIPMVGLTPKVEMRPEGKLKTINGKQYVVPRLFGNGDLSILIEHKRVFGMLFEHLKNYHQITGDMVGINPYSFGWKSMYDELRKFPNVFTTDISGCDTCHTAEETEEFFEFCNEYFFHFKKGTRNYNRLKCACESILSVWYVWKDVLYSSAGKNPSGCLITCIINAFMIYTRYQKAFYDLQYIKMRTMEKPSEMEAFTSHVCCKLFGDDSVISVSDEVKDWYNRVTIIKWLKDNYDMKVTDASKSECPTSFDDWDTVDFLQRRFVYDREDALVRAPLAKESLYKCLYYIDKKPGNGTEREWVAHYDQLIRGCMHELAMHEESVYDEFVKAIKPRYQLMGGKWNYPSYLDLYTDYYDKYYLS